MNLYYFIVFFPHCSEYLLQANISSRYVVQGNNQSRCKNTSSSSSLFSKV